MVAKYLYLTINPGGMADYKCDYCVQETYAIRLDPKTGKSESLCHNHIRYLNADQLDKEGIYIPVRLIELLRNKGGSEPIVADSVEGLVAELTKLDKDKKPVTTQ